MKTEDKIKWVGTAMFFVLFLCLGTAWLYRTVELKLAAIETPVSGCAVVMKHYRGRDYHVTKDEYQGEYDIQSMHYEWNNITNPDGTEEYYGQKMTFQQVYYERPDGISGYMTEPVIDPEGKKYRPQELDEIKALQVMDYEEYAAFCEEWEITPEYTDPNLNYIVRSFYTDEYYYIQEFCGIQYDGSTAKLYILEESTPSVADSACHIYTVPTDQDVDTVEVVYVYSEEEYENILEFGTSYDPYNLF